MPNQTLTAALGSLALVLTLGAPAPAAALPPQACVESTDRLASLTLQPADPAVTKASIRWTDRASAGPGTLARAYDLTGDCASAVAGFVMSVGALETGESFAISSDALTRPEKPAWPLIEPDPIEGDPPSLPGGRFVMATAVNGSRDYLGLWQTDEGSVVATFVRRDGATVGKVEPLFRSSLPLTSIAYFPAPDTQAGLIGVVQQAGGGVTRLIDYDWYHPNAFKTAP